MYALQNVSRTGNSGEIIRIAEKLLTSTNNDYRYGAIQSLCFTYHCIDDNDKAVRYAAMVPDNADLLVHVLKGDKLIMHCQWYFWRACENFSGYIAYLTECKESGYTAGQRYRMKKILYDMYHMIFSDGDFGFREDRLGRLCFSMALASVESGEPERALDELEEMTEHFEKSGRFVSIDHTSPLVNKIHYEDAMVGRSCEESICLSYLEHMKIKTLDGLRELPRFRAVEDKLREIAG